MMDSEARRALSEKKLSAIVDELREQILEEEVSKMVEAILIEALSTVKERRRKPAPAQAPLTKDVLEKVADPSPAHSPPVADILPEVPLKRTTKEAFHDWPALATEFIAAGLSLDHRGDRRRFLLKKGVPLGSGGHFKEAVRAELAKPVVTHARLPSDVPPSQIVVDDGPFASNDRKSEGQLRRYDQVDRGRERPYSESIHGVMVQFVASFPIVSMRQGEKRCYKCVAVYEKGDGVSKCLRCGGPLHERELVL